MADALVNENALGADDYESNQAAETIYVRIESLGNSECFNLTEFGIKINLLPQPPLEENYVICPGNPELQLDGGDFNSWSWRDGSGNEISTSRTLDVVQLGDYSLSVSQSIDGVSCEKTVSFNVASSGAPEDLSYQIEGFFRYPDPDAGSRRGWGF